MTVHQFRGHSCLQLAFTENTNVSRTYTTNGLNQYSAVGGAGLAYDANGNLTYDGTTTYVYDVENRLIEASTGGELTYDPLGRLWRVRRGAVDTRFLYDGDQLAAEYDAAGNMVRRYVFGPGVDEPVLVDEGGMDCSATRFLHHDERGSVVALTGCAADVQAINRYDEYGVPQSGNFGRFQYTGQMWLNEVRLYYYKARLYDPRLGRFLQVDPIGYDDQMNLYAYVGNDPVNSIDPTGREICFNSQTQCVAYRESLELAARAGNANMAERIRNDDRYWIVFLPEDKISELVPGQEFAFTDRSVTDDVIVTFLPDDFSTLYERHKGTDAQAARAAVVAHEGSHYEDYRQGRPKAFFEGGRDSPSERKADAIENSTLRRATSLNDECVSPAGNPSVGCGSLKK